VPGIINYQGRVTVGGTNFTGTGSFKFALINNTGATTYWSNGVSAVSLTVTKGLYSVLLGDTTIANMTVPTAASVFNNSDVRLRVWFDDGVNGSQQLSPDQRLGAAGYALVASALRSGATISASTAAPAASVTNTTDNPAALSFATPYRTWWVGQNRATDAPLQFDNFFVYDQNANATRLRIDIGGVIYGKGAGLTGITVSAANITGTIPASQIAAPPPGMVLIPGGSFTMGNSIGDADITDAATVTANVSAFYMDANPVSWSQWQSVYFWATNNGFGFVHAGAGKAANHPVQAVDWYDCVKWCNVRSEQAGKTPVYYTDAGFTTVYRTGEVTVYANWAARGYRLPTEAEREKAARGGLNGQRFPWGNLINQNLANYYGDTASYGYDLGPNGYNAAFTNGVSPYTSPVGSFAANVYGLYDMAGNVFEWCWDWYGIPYGQPTTTNPTGPGTGTYRIYRGGGWGNSAAGCRSADRRKTNPTSADYSVGFRAVLSPN
jgi:formylglycine-generating enzyme required for sulfatase activity